MKKVFLFSLAASCAALTLFSSCSGCVKKATKSVTELGISAVEGVAEAVDEHGERVSEKAADAAGKVAVGVGRSLDKFLDEHAEKIASVGGRTVVQAVDGFTGGFNEEVDTHYDKLPYTDNFCSGVSLDYFAKYKETPVVDAYFIIMEKGTYKCKFECTNNSGKVFLTKDAEIEKVAGERKYSLVSFSLNPQEEKEFTDIKDVKITVTKK
ncbi:hypothetical protein M2451_001246 [Dysgonomonas sp. PFB1-18]|uniref:hypothetical protein n=1 Tax=unclassified Dysgonomonas TaxID=2630389 RepID=UPI002475E3CA|nr:MULTISPECIES: hypothetical protein [unclassified Dysgonomonas]MDH6308680.1 hypothetical protein [Dysgonomonas sp. PF1-14]MDH6338623.1 hypothetical protein [Dysgonomonas sp. PF1-16]MDH6379929.1 hypothetical protein [Dysgonomonas sp. PFB1-18]MDH6397451.1 hypothetical protein [Dysgonomonas sp. PF1-23]